MDLLKMPEKERQNIINRLKEQYPKGTKVELVSMNDPYVEMHTGLKGVVKFVDDIGTIHVSWENGSGLGVIYGEDIIKKISD